MDKKEKKITTDIIKVTALLDRFKERRFMTLQWPDSYKKIYRTLQSGEAADIDVKYFDPLILREVKDGNS